MSISEELEQSVRTIPDFPKPGIMFKDITPVLHDAGLCDRLADALIEPFKEQRIDAIAAIESRGFLLGTLMAQKLNCPLILVRKVGKLPGKTVAQTYDLEYGSATIEIHEDSFEKGANVLIHDDLLATGGTAEAAAALCSKLGAHLVGFSFIIELGFLNGGKLLQPYSENIVSIVNY